MFSTFVANSVGFFLGDRKEVEVAAKKVVEKKKLFHGEKSFSILLYLIFLQPTCLIISTANHHRSKWERGRREMESEKIILYWIRFGTRRVVWKLSEKLPEVISAAIHLNARTSAILLPRWKRAKIWWCK